MVKFKTILFVIILIILIVGFKEINNNTILNKQNPEALTQDEYNYGSGKPQNVNLGLGPFRVTRVVDGDTIKIDYNGKSESVRFIGIDTPEIQSAPPETIAFGRKAAKFTQKLLSGKKIRLIFDERERDKYGRLLAYVYTEEGTFVNAELVRQGYALAMTVPPDVKYEALFGALQKQARKEYRGLWSLEGFRLENGP